MLAIVEHFVRSGCFQTRRRVRVMTDEIVYSYLSIVDTTPNTPNSDVTNDGDTIIASGSGGCKKARAPVMHDHVG